MKIKEQEEINRNLVKILDNQINQIAQFVDK